MRVALSLVGPGLIGRTLLAQIDAQVMARAGPSCGALRARPPSPDFLLSAARAVPSLATPLLHA
jgi:hypothetical protein